MNLRIEFIKRKDRVGKMIVCRAIHSSEFDTKKKDYWLLSSSSASIRKKVAFIVIENELLKYAMSTGIVTDKGRLVCDYATSDFLAVL